ncbi:MAG: DUF4423 domain-containing protein, partial [Bdellovibrionales bacterium]
MAIASAPTKIAVKASYVEFLQEELLNRKVRNPVYSERAFARALGLSPGFMKLLFQRKKNLSAARASEVALRLSWSELKKKSFLQLVLADKGKTLPSSQTRLISLDHFVEISDWYHFAILELIRVFPRETDTRKFARRLGITSAEANFAFGILQRKGMVKLTRQGFRSPKIYAVPSIS